MQLFFTDQRKVWKVGQVAGLSRSELSALFARRPAPPGTPILLDEAMRPVEPVSSWFRSLALERKDAKTMRSYAYSVLMLLHFLLARGTDLQSVTETELREFRLWRQDEAEEVVGDAAWDRDWAAIESPYRYLIRIGVVARQPWRATPQGSNLASRVRPDLRFRHMELDQYLYLRDVGFGGLTPDAGLDVSFRGWRPHRNRAACELALMTGMRIQEWSTLLLPELGLVDGRRPAFADVELKACAKFGRPRSAYVAPDPMEVLGPYLLLERPEIVAKAQRSLRRRHRELFVIQRLEADGTRVRGVLDGRTITRTVKNMKPDLRRLAVVETGDGLDPLALFIGQGGRMLTFSAWDKIRWRAWDRMKAWAGDRHGPVLPRRCWVYHDLRHTFAFDADSRGEAIGFGPGADQMRSAFAAVREKAEALRANGKAQRGDVRVEHGLLKRTHLSIRFGKLNHCTLDENNPVGAKCLEDAVVPPGHRGPLIDRCQPARCSNSIIAPEHLPIWQAEHASLTKLRSLPALPANRRALIDQQIRDVESRSPRQENHDLSRPARSLRHGREGPSRGHGTALHWSAPAYRRKAHAYRRKAHQAEPLAGGRRQPGHDEPGNRSARRLG